MEQLKFVYLLLKMDIFILLTAAGEKQVRRIADQNGRNGFREVWDFLIRSSIWSIYFRIPFFDQLEIHKVSCPMFVQQTHPSP